MASQMHALAEEVPLKYGTKEPVMSVSYASATPGSGQSAPPERRTSQDHSCEMQDKMSIHAHHAMRVILQTSPLVATLACNVLEKASAVAATCCSLMGTTVSRPVRSCSCPKHNPRKRLTNTSARTRI